MYHTLNLPADTYEELRNFAHEVRQPILRVGEKFIRQGIAAGRKQLAKKSASSAKRSTNKVTN